MTDQDGNQELAKQTERAQKQTQDPKCKGKLKEGRAGSARAVQDVVPFHFLHVGIVFFHGNPRCQVLFGRFGPPKPSKGRCYEQTA